MHDPITQNANFPLVVAPRGAPTTMSSIEIAELTDKDHKNVMRDIRVMLGGLKIEPTSFEGVYVDSQGKRQKCYNLPKRECLGLVSGYSVELRMRIIDRWMALEEAIRQPSLVIDFSDPKVMLGVVQHLQEQVTEKDVVIAEQGTRLKKLDRLEHAHGSMCMRDAAKTLNVRPIDLTTLMSTRRWIHKRVGNKHWVAYQDKIQAGYLEHAEHLYVDDQGRERVATRVLVTAKGLLKLAELLEQPLH